MSPNLPQQLWQCPEAMTQKWEGLRVKSLKQTHIYVIRSIGCPRNYVWKQPSTSTINNAAPTKKWRIAIGCDRLTFFFPKYWKSIQDARLSYKNIINADLLKDRRVAEVVDVGG